jgi:hypothetical protein
MQQQKGRRNEAGLTGAQVAALVEVACALFNYERRAQANETIHPAVTLDPNTWALMEARFSKR